MRLLVVAPFLPDFAAAHGGGSYLSSLLSGLSEVAEVGLAALVSRDEEMRLPDTRGAWQQAFVARRPDRRSGWIGTLDRLSMLWRWRHQPLVAAKHWLPAFAERLAAARARFRPDAVLIEMAQMAQYLPFLADLPTILTDHEAGVPANTHTGLGRLGDARDRRMWRRYVHHFYPQASLLQAVTPEDAAELERLTGRQVHVRPPVCALPAKPVAPGEAPPRALFLGDFSHGPNPEAARRLVRDILPGLRAAVPECELWFAGLHSDRIADLRQVAGVRVLGFVPDVQVAFGQVRLLLAPVWSGTGFRMKGLSALAHGLPVVTNSLGARGLDVPASARRVADADATMVDTAVAWLRDPGAAAEAGRAAREFVQRHVSPRGVAALQVARVQSLLRPTAS
jgi:glycosyltransferase involved in cell wall biosynthesis